MLHLLQHDTSSPDDDMLPPASPEVMSRLEHELGVAVHPFFLELYRIFGGYAAPDEHMIALWPPERIIAEKATATSIDARRYFAVGDLMIDSDFLMVCLEDASAPAYLQYAGDRIAASAPDLFKAVLAGQLAV